VVAILLALYWREKTGQGQFVDTSIVEAGLYFNSDVWSGPEGSFSRPRLDQLQTGLGALYRLYNTRDEWIAISCCNETHWLALAEVTGGPELIHDPRFSTPEARSRHANELNSVLEATFARDTANRWFELLDKAGVPVEIAHEDGVRDWATDSDLIKSGLVAEYRHPQYGRMRQFGNLVQFSETPGRVWGPPPLLGQHTTEILRELGYAQSEIEDLIRKSVIKTA
jgi:crotonobetainyl-CoA:carnitine CoA-transferase CaiB-like acyl-CoA transferase